MERDLTLDLSGKVTIITGRAAGDKGVRANAIGAGVIETGFLGGPVSKAALASYGYLHPIGRVGQPAEIAYVIAFLASPRASFITGALVMADGGYTAL